MIRCNQSFTVFGIAVLLCSTVRAASYCVSQQGNDASPGTMDQPWRTIQKAANTLAPGDTVYVREGIYAESVSVNVSGSKAAGNVSFLNFPNETPVLDGTTLTPSASDYSAFFYLNARSYVVIQGFEIRNFKATHGNGAPSGIHVEGGSHDIQIRANNIHGIEYDTAKGNAFGISIYGTSKTQPITNVVIDGEARTKGAAVDIGADEF